MLCHIPLRYISHNTFHKSSSNIAQKDYTHKNEILMRLQSEYVIKSTFHKASSNREQIGCKTVEQNHIKLGRQLLDMQILNPSSWNSTRNRTFIKHITFWKRFHLEYVDNWYYVQTYHPSRNPLSPLGLDCGQHFFFFFPVGGFSVG